MNDIYLYQPANNLISFIKAYNTPGFRFIFWWRIAKKKRKYTIKGFISRVMVRLLSRRYGFQIPVSVDIGSMLDMPHYGYVTVNSKVKIGHDCYLGPGVTIGQEKRGVRNGAPTIGDYVYLGANAVIVGKIIIGNNVLVAPNAFINQDIPSDSVVIGNPAKIVAKERATEHYIKRFDKYASLNEISEEGEAGVDGTSN